MDSSTLDTNGIAQKTSFACLLILLVLTLCLVDLRLIVILPTGNNDKIGPSLLCKTKLKKNM